MDLSENETPVLITRPGLPAMIVCVFVNLPVRTVPHATNGVVGNLRVFGNNGA